MSTVICAAVVRMYSMASGGIHRHGVAVSIARSGYNSAQGDRNVYDGAMILVLEANLECPPNTMCLLT